LVFLVPNEPGVCDFAVDAVQDRSLLEQEPNLARFVRETLSDADGNFAFNNLPGGKYFIVARARWSSPGVFNPGHMAGRVLRASISIT